MNKLKITCEMARAEGTIAMLYAIVRDYLLSIEPEKGCKLDDVVADTINGMNEALTELNGGDEHADEG